MDDDLNAEEVHIQTGSTKCRKRRGSSGSRRKDYCCCCCSTAVWKEHARDLDVHGVRRMTCGDRRGFGVRRCVWCGILVIASAAFVYNFLSCLIYYLTNPVNTTHRFLQGSDVPFPSITLCNKNPFRITELTKRGWYPWFHHLYNPSPDGSQSTPTINATSREIYASTGHSIGDMLLRCDAGSRECSSLNFSTSLIEDGVCFTFNNTHLNSLLETPRTLKLLLNIERYEYSNLAASFGAGLRVITHPGEEHPSHLSKGLMLPPGINAFVSVAPTRVMLPSPPSGSCSLTAETAADCRARCQSEAIWRKCKCKPHWMSSKRTDASLICKLDTHLNCVIPVIENLPWNSGCDCQLPCRYVLYEPTLSYNSFPEINVNKLMTNHQLKPIKSRYCLANDIRARASPDIHDKDKRDITALTTNLDEVIVGFEGFRENIKQAMASVRATLIDLKPRVSFHLHVALGGIRKTMEKGFINPWETVEERMLRPLATGFYEIISFYDRIIKQLMFTSTSETTMRKVLYFMTDSELSGKLENAIQSLDNLTKVYYSFLNAEPMYSYIVTPERRYDASLIPYNILSHNTVAQKDYYSGMSENIAGTIEQLLALKNVLKEVYQSNNLNETAYKDSRKAFIEHSQEINYYLSMFRTKVIAKARDVVEQKVDTFRKLNHTLHTMSDELLKLLDDKEGVLNTKYYKAYSDIVTFAQETQRYATDASLRKSSLIASGLSAETEKAFATLEAIVADLKASSRHGAEVWDKIHRTVELIWRELLEDETCKNFYFQLYNDVTDMVNNPMKSTFFMDIFLHPKILGKNRDEIQGLQPKDFYVLLNADIPVINIDRKIADIGNDYTSLTKRTDIDHVVNQKLKSLMGAYHTLKGNLRHYKEKCSVGPSFSKENLINVEVHLDDAFATEVGQVPAYPLHSFLADIGALLAMFLGASLISLLEIIDITFQSMCMRKSKKHGPKDPIDSNHVGVKKPDTTNGDRAMHNRIPRYDHHSQTMNRTHYAQTNL